MGIKGGEGNINAKRIIELAEGSAKCFMIDDGEKQYFF